MNVILQRLVGGYADIEVCINDIQKGFQLIAEAYRRGGKLLVCGNGGSAADSEHIVAELMKGYLSDRPVPSGVRQCLARSFPGEGIYLADHLQGALPAVSLASQMSLVTACANDIAADMVFAQQVYGYGSAGDVLLALSTSGKSANVLRALQVARVRKVGTVGLTGGGECPMRPLCDVAICVPAEDVSLIQERHRAIYHALCAMLEKEFFNG